MNSDTQIKLFNLAQEKLHKADNPAIVSSIDDAIADLFSLSQLDISEIGYLETNICDNILKAVFGEDYLLIPKVCLNPSRFWQFCDRFAFISNQGKSQGSTVQTTIEAIRNDNCYRDLGQQRFLDGIADATIVVHLTAYGYLLWDSLQYKMVQCPLHWQEADITNC